MEFYHPFFNFNLSNGLNQHLFSILIIEISNFDKLATLAASGIYSNSSYSLTTFKSFSSLPNQLCHFFARQHNTSKSSTSSNQINSNINHSSKHHFLQNTFLYSNGAFSIWLCWGRRQISCGIRLGGVRFRSPTHEQT